MAWSASPTATIRASWKAACKAISSDGALSRRRRRREADDPENHDRWLVSYADFITLLFAFFVVMYGISSINEGKYRVMSDSIVFAFRSDPGTAPGAMVSTGHAEAINAAAIRVRRNQAGKKR
jgi:chemotaxis protein MotB